MTPALAKAVIDQMPLPILADLFEDETGEDASVIRRGQSPFTISECEEFLWGSECSRLLKLSLMNLVSELQERRFSEGLIEYLLRRCDWLQKRAVRAAFYGEPVCRPHQKLSGHDYEQLLKVVRALKRGREEHDLRQIYARTRLLRKLS